MALAKLRGYAGLSESSMITNAISTKSSIKYIELFKLSNGRTVTRLMVKGIFSHGSRGNYLYTFHNASLPTFDH